MNNGGAAEGVEVAAADHHHEEEEEEEHDGHSAVSLNKGNIAVSLCMACVAAAVLSSELGPAALVCSAGLAGAASFGWSVLLGRETEHMAPDDDDDH